MNSVSDTYVYIHVFVCEKYASDVNNVYDMNLHDESN